MDPQRPYNSLVIASHGLCKHAPAGTSPRVQANTSAPLSKAPRNCRVSGCHLRSWNYSGSTTVSSYFQGWDPLGLQTSAMKLPHLFPADRQDRLCRFTDPSHLLLYSLEGFLSCSPLLPQLFTRRSGCPILPRTAPAE